MPSASSLPIVSIASPPAAPQGAAATSFVASTLDQWGHLIATLEQNAIAAYQALGQVIVQEMSSFEEQMDHLLGINPTPPNPSVNTTVAQPSSDSGSGRGNASGSGSGGGAQTANNAPNQTLNNSTQQSGHGSGGGSSTTTTQIPTGLAAMKAQPLDGGGSGSLFNGSGPGSGVTGSGTGSGPASGQVWLDNNGNGNLDNGETGYQGITVNLLHFDADGSVDGEFSTTTDGDGDYQFNLELGPDAQTYAIEVVLGSATIPVVATIPGISQIGPHGMSQKFQLANGGARFVEAGVRSMQVTTTQDDPGGAIHMQVTLRDAINTGNEFGGKFVTFADQAGDALNGTITLQAALPPIAQSFNIVGPGPTALAVSGANSFGVFNVYETSTISGLTIENGFLQGGGGAGIDNAGDLTLLNDVIYNNQTTGLGGGISNDAQLSLQQVQIKENTAARGGGGISNTGSVQIYNGVTINLNNSGNGGAGISNAGTISAQSYVEINNNTNTGGGGSGVQNSGGKFQIFDGGSISGNISAGNGGGVNNDAGGTMTLQGVEVSGNSSAGDGGGGIFVSSGSVTLTDVYINGKNSGNEGGGMFVKGGTVKMSGGGISTNAATYPGRTVGGVIVQGGGGGLFVGGGSVTLTGVPINNNVASLDGGGVF